MADDTDVVAPKSEMLEAALAVFQFDSEDAEDRFQNFLDQLSPDLHDAFEEVAADFVQFSYATGISMGYAIMRGLMEAGKVTVVLCKQCKRPFMRKRPDKRFCGDACRVQADRAKNF